MPQNKLPLKLNLLVQLSSWVESNTFTSRSHLKAILGHDLLVGSDSLKSIINAHNHKAPSDTE